MEILITWRELKRDVGFALGILRRRPFNVLLQVTNRCNMTCGMCGFWSSGVSQDEELTVEDYCHLEEELSGMGRFLVSIEGGEPLIRGDLLEIVELFSRRHLTVLYTNGWLMDHETARALYSRGLAQVGISIDFHDPLEHDGARGVDGAFEQAWEAVEACRDAAPHRGRQVHVMTVLTEESVDSVEKLLQRSAEMGVGYYITLISKKGAMRGTEGRYPTRPVSRRLIQMWNQYPNFRVFRTYLELIDAFLFGDRVPSCRAGSQSFNIDSQGNVARCIERIDRPAGNVKHEGLAEIWTRMAVADHLGACNECWSFCRGFPQLLGSGGSFRAWVDLFSRMKSV